VHKNKGNKMDKNKGEIVEYEIANLSKLKTEIFNDYGERKYKIISILPRKEKYKDFSGYDEYYLVYVELGSTLKEIEEKKIAKENKKKELLDLINSIYDFVLPEEKKKEIAFLKEKEKKDKKLKEAEEFRRRNSPTIEELKEDLQKAKDNAREVTENLKYLR
jgi:hypothetical protein